MDLQEHKHALEKQLAQLWALHEKLEGQLESVRASINAKKGALAFCNALLAEQAEAAHAEFDEKEGED